MRFFRPRPSYFFEIPLFLEPACDLKFSVSSRKKFPFVPVHKSKITMDPFYQSLRSRETLLRHQFVSPDELMSMARVND